jgi:capsular polysaccharide transport system permease protein
MVIIKIMIFGRASDNFDFAAFLALNFTAYNMFRNITKKSMGSFKANKALFVYKQVKPIDTIIARVMVEIFVTGIILLAFVAIGAYFGYDLNVQNLPMVAFGFLWLMIFSFSFGLFIAVSNTFYPSVGKSINISMIFLMFGSAVFYTVEMLPPEIQTFLLYNPLTHFMEMIHGYYFYVLDDRFVNYNYMLLWTLSLLFMGLWFYRKLEERIISL